MTHEHSWQVSRPCGDSQLEVSCECGIEIYVCPCGDERIAIEAPDGSVRYASLITRQQQQKIDKQQKLHKGR